MFSDSLYVEMHDFFFFSFFAHSTSVCSQLSVGTYCDACATLVPQPFLRTIIALQCNKKTRAINMRLRALLARSAALSGLKLSALFAPVANDNDG